MKLNKEQALLLSNVLSCFKLSEAAQRDREMLCEVTDFHEILNEFILCEDSEDDDELDDSEEDEETDEEHDEPDPPAADHVYVAGKYCDLPRLRTSTGTIEFDADDESDALCLLVDGYVETEQVLRVKRNDANVFEVWHDGDWTAYTVKRFSKAWTQAFVPNKVYGLLRHD